MADKISIYTNSQSAVKPRDLRSNDKRVSALKRSYENAYGVGGSTLKSRRLRVGGASGRMSAASRV
ncbi:MAG: hypothetical protein KBA71_10330 [Opitutaceae bacterium]|nr:hypothetical protein [Opitutaceae bacterium]